jgi:hypothetical protein
VKFRLLKTSEYSLYSEPLQLFEAQFNYPLGDKKFKISHGKDSGNYFSFFKSLGQENVFVLEHKDKLLGVGCAILRSVGTQRFWYLCDFKLNKSIRGKNRLTWLLLRFIIPFYCRSKHLVVINMSEPKYNWLVKKLNSMLFFLKLKVKPIYFYEWTYKEYKERVNIIPDAFKHTALYTNYGIKDIIIEGEVKPVIHIVNKEHASFNLPLHEALNLDKARFEVIKDGAIFMMASRQKLKGCETNKQRITPSYIGTMVCSKAINEEDLRFSSLEI